MILVDIQLTVGDFVLTTAFEHDAGPLVVIGPNGAGKSTLLKTIIGAHSPSSGRICVNDRVFFDAQAGVDIAPNGRRIGYVPQSAGLFGHMNCLDNVAFGLIASEPDVQKRRARAMAALEDDGLGALATRKSYTLSGGEKQRVALARAMVLEPAVLLLDEPLASVDVLAKRALRERLAERLADLSVPSIVVTHDVRDVLAFGFPLIVLKAGHVVAHGDIVEVKQGPSEFVAEFFAT